MMGPGDQGEDWEDEEDRPLEEGESGWIGDDVTEPMDGANEYFE